jgi:hypothetical protein
MEGCRRGMMEVFGVRYGAYGLYSFQAGSMCY